MSQGVLFFNHGTACLLRLMVALRTLRRHYGGDIHIRHTGDSTGILGALAEEFRCTTSQTRIKVTARGKNDAYYAKPSIALASPFRDTIWLDSDVIIKGDITPLFAMCRFESHPIFTRFADWTTKGGLVHKRLKRWDRGCVPKTYRTVALEAARSTNDAVNTGVFSYSLHPLAGAINWISEWNALTQTNHSFICDEIACQILLKRYPQGLLEDKWNWSPRVSKSPQKDAIVWHFHGRQHARREPGIVLWQPEFWGAWNYDVCGVRTWGNRYADRHQMARWNEFRERFNA